MSNNPSLRSLNPLERQVQIDTRQFIKKPRQFRNLFTMGTEVERTDGELPNTAEEDLRSLEESYAELRDETQQLINERTTLEAEMRTLRKRIERLDENVNLLKMPPLIVATFKMSWTTNGPSYGLRTEPCSKCH